jgi:pimeloyl-ACP methyl ester carboxylesterase
MRLAFERVGAGEPLVLLHGVGHRRQAWYPVLDQLAKHREVILLDFPGHGESGPLITEGRPLVDVLRAAFRQFLAEQQLDRPHVAGNSLGGRVALEAAAAGDARSATGLSPAGFWRTERSFAYTRTMFKTLSRLAETLEPQAERLSRTAAGRALVYGWFTAHPGRISAAQALADFRAFRQAQPALHEILAAASRFTEPIPDEVPVTVAWGARDLVFPRVQLRQTRALLPNAEVVVLRGCGHVPMTDAPEQVAEVLLRGSAPRTNGGATDVAA